VKAVADRTAAGVGLMVSLPLLIVVAMAVAWDLGRPVLFRQRRPGWHGAPFDLLKFRTMREGDGGDGDRLTALGRFLRSTSLDELPELWNVVRGEMSLVGPRPLMMRYLERYTPEQARRHDVRPGITGWAQVHGRNALGWSGRLALDVWYVDNWSLALDVRILLLTVGTVLSRRGISAPGSATMPEFQGDSEKDSAPRGRVA
jgi:lipopolysaccharide/colanic/teichoic acid biosynthesis glycosyltransferase